MSSEDKKKLGKVDDSPLADEPTTALDPSRRRIPDPRGFRAPKAIPSPRGVAGTAPLNRTVMGLGAPTASTKKQLTSTVMLTSSGADAQPQQGQEEQATQKHAPATDKMEMPKFDEEEGLATEATRIHSGSIKPIARKASSGDLEEQPTRLRVSDLPRPKGRGQVGKLPGKRGQKRAPSDLPMPKAPPGRLVGRGPAADNRRGLPLPTRPSTTLGSDHIPLHDAESSSRVLSTREMPLADLPAKKKPLSPPAPKFAKATMLMGSSGKSKLDKLDETVNDPLPADLFAEAEDGPQAPQPAGGAPLNANALFDPAAETSEEPEAAAPLQFDSADTREESPDMLPKPAKLGRTARIEKPDPQSIRPLPPAREKKISSFASAPKNKKPPANNKRTLIVVAAALGVLAAMGVLAFAIVSDMEERKSPVAVRPVVPVVEKPAEPVSDEGTTDVVADAEKLAKDGKDEVSGAAGKAVEKAADDAAKLAARAAEAAKAEAAKADAEKAAAEKSSDDAAKLAAAQKAEQEAAKADEEAAKLAASKKAAEEEALAKAADEAAAAEAAEQAAAKKAALAAAAVPEKIEIGSDGLPKDVGKGRNDSMAWIERARSASGSEKLSYLRAAVKAQQRNPHAQEALARHQLVLGNPQEALTHAKRAAKLRRNRNEYHVLVGDIEVVLGHPAAAKAAYRAALNAEPRDRIAKRKLAGM